MLSAGGWAGSNFPGIAGPIATAVGVNANMFCVTYPKKIILALEADRGKRSILGGSKRKAA